MTRSSFFPYALVLLALAFLTRLHALWIPVLDIDETQFVGFAQVLLDGGKPYLDSTDTKPPMIYWVVAAILKIFGRNNLLGLHIATIVWVWATAIAIYFLTGRLFDRRTALFSGLLYILFSAGFEVKFISTSITQFMNLPLVLATFSFVVAVSSPAPLRRRAFLLLSGLATAAAFNFKYQGGIQLPILLTGLLIFRKKENFLAGIFLRDSLLVMAGFVFGLALVWWPLAGVWDEFVFWSLKGSFNYIRDGRHSWVMSCANQTGAFVFSMLPLVLLAGRAIRTTTRSGERRRLIFVFLWLMATLIPVSVGGRFYGHYFLQLMPPLVILASAGLAAGLQSLMLKGKAALLTAALALLFVMVPMGLRFYYPEMIRLRGEETFEVHQRVGEALKEMAGKEGNPTHLFVWGFATPIYTFSGLSPSSRFLWTDVLSGRTAGPPPSPAEVDEMVGKGSRRAWAAFWEDMAKRPPTYFVDTSPASIHDYEFFPISRYPMLKGWLDANYERCGEVDKVVIYCRITSRSGWSERGGRRWRGSRERDDSRLLTETRRNKISTRD